MRFFFVSLLIIAACTPGTEKRNDSQESESRQTYVPEFQTIIDSVKLDGAILLFDPLTNTYLSNDFEYARRGFLPASTFKIPNSIIALETGVVEDDSTLLKWDGKPRRLKSWETDLIFKQAFLRSCYPCYQEIARKVGHLQMRAYLDKLQYGHMMVDSNSIDHFWLEGPSRISQFEQIDFIRRLHQKKLPISEWTTNLMKKLMFIEEKPGYRLFGKTGWSITDDFHNGWFVGYVEKGAHVYYFATNVSPGEGFDMDDFGRIRALITKEALKKANIV